MKRFVGLALLLGLMAGPAHAVLPQEQLPDPKLEARARHIGAELRCLVCQNQSIDDSDAPLAGDLRVILRERIMAGDSDQQAINYIVARYGSFVLLKPPFDAETLGLWLGPFALLAAGGLGVGLYLRHRSTAVAGATPDPLSDDEQDRLHQLLEANDLP
ncbi:MAG TPA: cytochrome c-type biogenesis protein [Caulobacteraceae bacterium]|nr:cytochrome c-type biogenesis protein [Caulobacteraceae bacterium]